MIIRFNDGTEFPMAELTEDHLSHCFNEWKNHWSEDLDGYFDSVRMTIKMIRGNLWGQVNDGEEEVSFDSLLPPDVARILWGGPGMCSKCFQEPSTLLEIRTYNCEELVESWIHCPVCFEDSGDDDLEILEFLYDWPNLDSFFEDDWDNSVFQWIMDM